MTIRNGLGTVAFLEERYLYPLLKASDVFHNDAPHRMIIVTQTSLTESPGRLERMAPHLWAYLTANTPRFDSRRSSIYRGRHRFSMFGVGPYTFAPYEIAVSGLHKEVHFRLISPMADVPVMLDDTCYFLPCDSRGEAQRILAILETPAVHAYLDAVVFWDNKRPITKSVLDRIDMAAIARREGLPWSHPGRMFD